MGTWVHDLECCVRDLRVSEGKLADLKRRWPDVADWRERPAGCGTLSIDPVYGSGSRLFTEDQPWSFESDAADLVAECEPGSVVDLFVEDDFSFMRIAKAADGSVRTFLRDVANPFADRT